MITYKKVIAKNGREMYYKNSKMISVKDVPQSILSGIADGGEISVGTPEPITEPKQEAENDQQEKDEEKQEEKVLSRVCLFCGEPKERTRFINLQTVYLCDEHYHSKTTGKIVQKMNETVY